MIAKQRDRKCATCRYFESSPLWRKGWCRNPLLYDPQTNHLVEADRLSCSRTFIDYWEPREGSRAARKAASSGVDPNANPRVAPSITMETTGPGGRALKPEIIPPPVTGSPRDRNPQIALVKPQPTPSPNDPDLSRWAPPTQGQLAVDAAEALVIENVPLAETKAEAPTLPVVVAPAPTVASPRPPTIVERLGGPTRVGMFGIVLLALLAVVGLTLFNNNGGKLPAVFGLQPTPTRPATPIRPTATAVPVVVPTEIPTDTPVPPTDTPSGPPTMRVGGRAQATGLKGQRLNVRRDPTTKADIVGKASEGVTLEIKDGPRDADNVTWWQVSGWDNVGTLGWVSGQFLQPVP